MTHAYIYNKKFLYLPFKVTLHNRKQIKMASLVKTDQNMMIKMKQIKMKMKQNDEQNETDQNGEPNEEPKNSCEKTHMLIKSQRNKSESHLPVNEEIKRNALSPAMKENLLRMAVDAFLNPIKLDLEEVTKNKWLKYKYKDQIQAEEKKRHPKWLDDADEAPTGFAIGRRIFEKAEIIVSHMIF